MIITIWIALGNIWVDLLQGIINLTRKVKLTLQEKIINILVWPYSIYTFMEGLKEGIEQDPNKSPSLNVSLDNFIDEIDKYFADKLGVELEVYQNIMDTKFTDDEIEDIVNVLITLEGDEEETKRVKELFYSKLKE